MQGRFGMEYGIQANDKLYLYYSTVELGYQLPTTEYKSIMGSLCTQI